MPAVIWILLFLVIALSGVLFLTKDSAPISEEQQVKFARIFQILLPVLLIGVVIKWIFF